MIAMGYLSANSNQCATNPEGEMIWWAMILSSIAGGYLLALVLSWSGQGGWAAGAKIGAIVGALVALNYDLSFYAMTSMFNNLTVIVVDVIAMAAMMAIGGAVAGLMMRK